MCPGLNGSRRQYNLHLNICKTKGNPTLGECRDVYSSSVPVELAGIKLIWHRVFFRSDVSTEPCVGGLGGQLEEFWKGQKRFLRCHRICPPHAGRTLLIKMVSDTLTGGGRSGSAAIRGLDPRSTEFAYNVWTWENQGNQI
ncbi:hypothetical protein B0H17DRAFT_1148808 [Mycena rosella]|uniref:Uncharacterized protein n=1 Tax=Mycena rosella TaxID=1033263 RepID=A0AAD7C9K0_MYCRO|nr:hypothetical protein B0H17DRAFT_1148808 [Mycena rosella]